MSLIEEGILHSRPARWHLPKLRPRMYERTSIDTTFKIREIKTRETFKDTEQPSCEKLGFTILKRKAKKVFNKTEILIC